MEKIMAIVAFVQAHESAFSALAVAIVDLAIALNPKLAGNGILDQVLKLIKKEKPAV